jgi:hypothetical protein
MTNTPVIRALELPTPTALLQVALQRSIDLVSFGLQVAQSATPSNLIIPDSILQFMPAQNLSMDINTVRQEFQVWVLANGFRDIVDSLGPPLEWTRQTCYLWSRPGSVFSVQNGRLAFQPKLTPEEWKSEIENKVSQFDRFPLPEKFNHLINTYGFELPALSVAILSLNAARNCLTHRKGIVGQLDLKEPTDKGLVINFRKSELFVSGSEGERIIDTSPAILNSGEMLSMRFVNSERIFLLGDRIQFTTREYTDVCGTFLAFALDLNEKIISFQDRKRRILIEKK